MKNKSEKGKSLLKSLLKFTKNLQKKLKENHRSCRGERAQKEIRSRPQTILGSRTTIKCSQGGIRQIR